MVRKVLVVDDSAFIHQMYNLVFSRYKDCMIVPAMDGIEALDKLSQETGIQLVILDINMPRLDGLGFLSRLKRDGMHDDLPVIIVSTEAKEDDIKIGMSMGAKGYMKKPFNPGELRALIDSMFEGTA